MTPDSIEEQIERAVQADVARLDTGLEEALRRSENAGEAVFLFGSDRATVHALSAHLRSAWPRLRLVGVCDAEPASPAAAVPARIAACAPDMVIADIAPKRHRALIAEFASCGLHTGLVNLPGTFARYVSTHPGVAGDVASARSRLPVRVARSLGELAGIMRQFVHGAIHGHRVQAYQAVRHDG